MNCRKIGQLRCVRPMGRGVGRRPMVISRKRLCHEAGEAHRMSQQIRVTTGARLHCGLFANSAESGRQFGGLGMMVSPPGFHLRASRDDRDQVIGPTYWHDRLASLLSHYRRTAPADRQPPPVCWEIEQSLPAHAGLGSGTQLGLAAARSLAILAGEDDVPATVLARRTGRGLRSAIGLHGFEQGGLIVEGGKRALDSFSPLVCRAPLPADWRFILIRPRDASGISGAEERQSLARLGPMPVTATDRLCRLAVMEIAPSALEADFEQFATSLAEFGRIVGAYFSTVQGGIFADPLMRKVAQHLEEIGIHRLCQTSWGPTLFVPVQSPAAADSLMNEIAAETVTLNIELTCAAPLNRGAIVEVANT